MEDSRVGHIRLLLAPRFAQLYHSYVMLLWAKLWLLWCVIERFETEPSKVKLVTLTRRVAGAALALSDPEA